LEDNFFATLGIKSEAIMATTSKGKKTKSKASSRFLDRICNLVPSKGTETDWKFQDALTAGLLAAPAALPASVDLRKAWWSINSQGSTGSCVGWASADGVLRHHLVAANKLLKTELLSPRFVWMASKETDEFNVRPETFIEEAGTSLKAAMDVIRKYGCVLDKDLPFNIGNLMYVGNENTFYALASTRKAANYFNLGKNVAQWKSWLATTGPIMAGLSVDSTWDNAASTNGNLDIFDPGSNRGGHAICIIGYKGDRFIVRNSWGTTWGDGGFGYASTNYINDAFFSESYGITL
jgi:C1A family cysteine protease